MKKFCWLVIVVLLMSACAGPTVTQRPDKVPKPPPPPVETPAIEEEQPLLTAGSWQDVPGWLEDDPSLALGAFLKSCTALRWRPQWQPVCAEAAGLETITESLVREFFERNFVPHRVGEPDGSMQGLLTGYYVPDLRGSRSASKDYPYPLYRRPDDLLVIDLKDLYPALGDYRLRGRIEEQRVVPYWSRADIDGEQVPLAGQELFWVDDPVELFFLHIQGSGRILLDDGSRVMVNYADQNGHPYRSIGKYMLEQGIMDRHQMSMQNIRLWAKQNPDQVDALLNQNPSYVFFRELADDVQSPPGALGVPLTPGRSLAVDRRYIPLGAPVFVETTWPNSDQPLRRLMVAQDTGGAIKGRIRGDFFWGMGARAGSQAGRMKQPVSFWLLLPRNGGNSQ